MRRPFAKKNTPPSKALKYNSQSRIPYLKLKHREYV